jgi:hypothetical protein
MATREPRYKITDLRPDKRGVDVHLDAGRRAGSELVAYSSSANAGDDWAVYERPVEGSYWSQKDFRSADKMLDYLVGKYPQRKAS